MESSLERRKGSSSSLSCEEMTMIRDAIEEAVSLIIEARKRIGDLKTQEYLTRAEDLLQGILRDFFSSK